MKAVIELDVPDWQIGQDVAVYFPDTMLKHGKCELLKEQGTANLYKCPNCGTWVSAENVVRCKDCWFGDACKSERGEHGVMCYNSCSANHGWVHKPDWFCADGKVSEME